MALMSYSMPSNCAIDAPPPNQTGLAPEGAHRRACDERLLHADLSPA
jgi:hypothetical protein